MARKISNMNQLMKAMMPSIKETVNEMADRVYETLNYFLLEYYYSYRPKSYIRLYDFLHSAVKVDAKVKGNKVVATVYIDTESMNNYYNATGVQVVRWANQGFHGGVEKGNGTPHVWDDTMKKTIDNGELLKLAVDYLRKKGYQVQV